MRDFKAVVEHAGLQDVAHAVAHDVLADGEQRQPSAAVDGQLGDGLEIVHLEAVVHGDGDALFGRVRVMDHGQVFKGRLGLDLFLGMDGREGFVGSLRGFDCRLRRGYGGGFDRRLGRGNGRADGRLQCQRVVIADRGDRVARGSRHNEDAQGHGEQRHRAAGGAEEILLAAALPAQRFLGHFEDLRR